MSEPSLWVPAAGLLGAAATFAGVIYAQMKTGERERIAREQRDRRDVCAGAIAKWHAFIALEKESDEALKHGRHAVQLLGQARDVYKNRLQDFLAAKRAGNDEVADDLERRLPFLDERLKSMDSQAVKAADRGDGKQVECGLAWLALGEATALLDITCAPATAAAYRGLVDAHRGDRGAAERVFIRAVQRELGIAELGPWVALADRPDAQTPSVPAAPPSGDRLGVLPGAL